MPTVSIIIPTYNRAALICESLDSVFAQTYQDFEVIVIDDGSTDNTQEVLTPYMDRIRYIKQENAGVSAARNRGMLNAQGEYIAFLDSDDLWLPEKLEKQVMYMTSHPECGFSYTDYYTAESFDSEKKSCLAASFDATNKTLFQILSKVSINLTPAVLFRRDILSKVGLMDTVLFTSQDHDFWLRCCFHAKTGFVNDVLVFCRDHVNRSVKLGKTKGSLGTIKSARIQIARWRGCVPDDIYKNMIQFENSCLFNTAWDARHRGDIKAAGKAFIEESITNHFSPMGLLRGILFLYFTPLVRLIDRIRGKWYNTY